MMLCFICPSVHFYQGSLRVTKESDLQNCLAILLKLFLTPLGLIHLIICLLGQRYHKILMFLQVVMKLGAATC